MKKALKKISAIAMAFTLLGACTTFTKSSSKSDNILVVAAAAPCQYHHGTVVQGYKINNARKETQTITRQDKVKHYDKRSGTSHTDIVETTYEYNVWICRACGHEVKRELVKSTPRVLNCPF